MPFVIPIDIRVYDSATDQKTPTNPAANTATVGRQDKRETTHCGSMGNRERAKGRIRDVIETVE